MLYVGYGCPPFLVAEGRGVSSDAWAFLVTFSAYIVMGRFHNEFPTYDAASKATNGRGGCYGLFLFCFVVDEDLAVAIEVIDNGRSHESSSPEVSASGYGTVESLCPGNIACWVVCTIS